MPKEFDRWNALKQKLNAHHHVPFFKERDVWWASIGVNVGHEQDGKNQKFNRPVLIVKKFNNRLFWGVPLTTQVKENRHYHQFTFKGKDQCAMLTQLRLWDANRLTDHFGRIGKVPFDDIRKSLSAYLES